MKDYSELKILAEAATPQDFDSAQVATHEGWIECPTCGGEGSVDLGGDYLNYDNEALGVQFYGIGDAHVKAEDYYRAANPATVLALIAEVERLSFREKMLSEYGCEYCAGSGHVHRIDGDYLGVCDSCSAYEFNCAKHEIEKLKNENESLKKDAARYRWLRQYDFDIGSYHPEGDFSNESWFERFDDQSIDRIIAEEIAFEEEAIIEANNK